MVIVDIRACTLLIERRFAKMYTGSSCIPCVLCHPHGLDYLRRGVRVFATGNGKEGGDYPFDALMTMTSGNLWFDRRLTLGVENRIDYKRDRGWWHSEWVNTACLCGVCSRGFDLARHSAVGARLGVSFL